MKGHTMDKLALRILISPPGGGKSTYAQQRAECGDIIADIDSIVTMVHGGDYKLYNIALKPLYKSVDGISTISIFPSNGKVNLYQSS